MSDNVSDNGVLSDKMSDKMSDNGALNSNMNDKMNDNVSDNRDMSDNLSDNVSDNGGLSDKMSDKTYRDKILAHLAGNGIVSTAEAARIIERNPKTARRVLLQLENESIVVATGANRNRMYRLVDGVRKTAKK
jgi:predicted HTH transcriptional regulator